VIPYPANTTSPENAFSADIFSAVNSSSSFSAVPPTESFVSSPTVSETVISND
jgi:hypothetical protein